MGGDALGCVRVRALPSCFFPGRCSLSWLVPSCVPSARFSRAWDSHVARTSLPYVGAGSRAIAAVSPRAMKTPPHSLGRRRTANAVRATVYVERYVLAATENYSDAKHASTILREQASVHVGARDPYLSPCLALSLSLSSFFFFFSFFLSFTGITTPRNTTVGQPSSPAVELTPLTVSARARHHYLRQIIRDRPITPAEAYQLSCLSQIIHPPPRAARKNSELARNTGPAMSARNLERLVALHKSHKCQ